MTKTTKMSPISKAFTTIKRAPSFGSIAFFIALFIIIGIFKPAFFTAYNFRVILLAAMVTIAVGFSQMITMSIDGMNLAIGAIGGMTAVICASMMQDFGMSTLLAISIGLIASIIAGLINGVLISSLGASPVMTWLITMGISYVYAGIQKAWNKGVPYHDLNKDFGELGAKITFEIPLLFIIVIIIGVLLWLLYNRTGLGRQLLAFGSNRVAAQLNGVNIRKTVILTHMFSGLLAGTAGLILSMRIATATVDIGAEWGFYSFAAPIIGGCGSGRVSVLGTIFGGIVLATIENGLIHFGLDLYWTTLVRGCVILLAVSFNTYRERALAKRR